jgi:hypothetical protein
MTKKTPEELALEAYMAGLNDKKLKSNDNNLIQLSNMIKTRGEEWKKKNAAVDRSKSEEQCKQISISSKRTRSKDGWKDGFKESMAIRNSKEDYQHKLQEGISKRTNNPDWIEKNKSKAKKLCKGLVTPDGIFPSISGAIEFYNNKRNSKYSESWLMTQRNRYPTEYFTISQEEYIMLTGKDI